MHTRPIRLKLELLSVLILSGVILTFPTNISLSMGFNNATEAFGNNLLLFCCLYLLWLGLIILLIFDYRKDPTSQVPFILVVLFGIVNFGFWIFATPFARGEDMTGIQLTQSVLSHGSNIVSPNVADYTEFPALFDFGASAVLLSGLGLFAVRAVVSFALIVVFSASSFLAYFHVLRSRFLAAIATLVLMGVGDIEILRLYFFHPDWMGIALLALLFAVITNTIAKSEIPLSSMILTLVLSGALTLAHLLYPMIGIALLFALVAPNLKSRGQALVLSLIALVALSSWVLFSATGWFSYVFGDLVFKNIASPVSGSSVNRINLVESLIINNLTATTWWASSAYLFWVSLVFGVGLVSWLAKAVRFRSANLEMKYLVVSTLTVGLLTIGMVLASPNYVQFFRILIYVPITLVPLAVSYFGKRIRMIVILAVCILAFMLPTFLAYPRLAVDNWYSYDLATLQYQANYVPIQVIQFPYSQLPEQFALVNSTNYWRALESTLNQFHAQTANSAYWELSPRDMINAQHLYGISLTNPNWTTFNSELGRSNLVYDNGYYKFFES